MNNFCLKKIQLSHISFVCGAFRGAFGISNYCNSFAFISFRRVVKASLCAFYNAFALYIRRDADGGTGING